MKYSSYSAAGSRLSGGSTITIGNPTPAPGGGTVATYDRLDIGNFVLDTQVDPNGVVDFAIPGDQYMVPQQYKFPRAGFILGLTLLGQPAIITAGFIVTKTSASDGTQAVVMKPADSGNTGPIGGDAFYKLGKRITPTSPIACNVDDVISIQLKSFNATDAQQMNMAATLNIGLTPQ